MVVCARKFCPLEPRLTNLQAIWFFFHRRSHRSEGKRHFCHPVGLFVPSYVPVHQLRGSFGFATQHSEHRQRIDALIDIDRAATQLPTPSHRHGTPGNFHSSTHLLHNRNERLVPLRFVPVEFVQRELRVGEQSGRNRKGCRAKISRHRILKRPDRFSAEHFVALVPNAQLPKPVQSHLDPRHFAGIAHVELNTARG